MKKMQMSEKLAFINRAYSSKEEALSAVCDAAEGLGFVNGSFKEDLLTREKDFPTGLQAALPLAIPHVGTNCNTSFMSVTTLSEPLEFKYMDGTEGVLPVEILFIFGIVDPADQIKVLKRLTTLFRDFDALSAIRNAKDDEEGCRIIVDYLGDLIEIGEGGK